MLSALPVKDTWPNSHPSYGDLLHKVEERGVILLFLIHQGLNL